MPFAAPTIDRVYLIDLDGTLIRGGRALPGAAEFLRHISGRFAVVSNNSSHTPARLSSQLAALGLDVPQDRLVLAGAVMVDWTAERFPGARVFIAGSGALASLARSARLRVVAEDPQVVLLARDMRFTYERLRRIANMVRAGAALVVANPDRTHPDDGDCVVPETGALLAALLACTGPVPYQIVGKPEPELYRRALSRLGAGASQALVVGDNPDTDGAGATRLGMACAIIGDHHDARFADLRQLAAWLARNSTAPMSRSAADMAISS